MQSGEPATIRKRILYGLGAVALAALAFGAGIFAHGEYQAAQIRGAEKFARELVGLDGSVPLAPAWDDWQYPGARPKATIQGASVRVSGKLERPAGRYAVFASKDAFEDVARFYAEKAHFEQPEQVARSQSATSSHGSLQGESNHLLDDHRDPADPEHARAARSKCLIRRCPSYDLTVFITRADEEPYTHIVLLYDPKTETEDSAPRP